MTGAPARITKSTTRTAVDSLLGSAVTHTPLDIQTTAANIIGSNVVSEVNHYATTSSSDSRIHKRTARQQHGAPKYNQTTAHARSIANDHTLASRAERWNANKAPAKA